jgi:hypothetical protein
VPRVFSRNGIAAGLACFGIGLALHAGDARALVVEVGGSNYDVTTVSGTYNGLLTTLSAQPWFGNATLAQTFATELSSGLGLPANNAYGPIFATGVVNDELGLVVFGAYYDDANGSTGWNSFGLADDTLVFAQAQLQPPAPSAVPAPLSLFGAMAGFGMSRRLRARIQAASPRRMGC